MHEKAVSAPDLFAHLLGRSRIGAACGVSIGVPGAHGLSIGTTNFLVARLATKAEEVITSLVVFAHLLFSVKKPLSARVSPQV
jgi:hypothetical protein